MITSKKSLKRILESEKKYTLMKIVKSKSY